MHILEHLFLVGEFPARAHLLSGLTLEQVTLCPDGASHSIYQELWPRCGVPAERAKELRTHRCIPTPEIPPVARPRKAPRRSGSHQETW